MSLKLEIEGPQTYNPFPISGCTKFDKLFGLHFQIIRPSIEKTWTALLIARAIIHHSCFKKSKHEHFSISRHKVVAIRPWIGLPGYKIKKYSHGAGVNIFCLISHNTLNFFHLAANSIALRFPSRTKVEDCFKRKASADVQDWNSGLECDSSGSRHFKGWKISEVQLKVSIVDMCQVFIWFHWDQSSILAWHVVKIYKLTLVTVSRCNEVWMNTKDLLVRCRLRCQLTRFLVLGQTIRPSDDKQEFITTLVDPKLRCQSRSQKRFHWTKEDSVEPKYSGGKITNGFGTKDTNSGAATLQTGPLHGETKPLITWDARMGCRYS